MFKNIIVYYFSGTGNTKRIANKITDIAKKKGLNTNLINIEKAGINMCPEYNDDTLIGFCYPTHGFNMPPYMLKFICKFSKSKKQGTKIFLLNTRYLL